ncbi:hypothetical protein B0H34DRAFT_408100 [Crassisporium funariophilum]|nr:hypothetical protein B0H34DRAFT_408100 [Crassisporium funariophilum]
MSKRHEIIDVDALPSTPERRKSSGIPMTIDLTQPKPKLNYKTLIILDDDESDEGGVVFVSSHSSRPGTTSSAIEKQGKVGKLHSNAGRIGQNSSGGDAGVAVTNLAREMHWQTQMSARASEQPHPQQIKGARISGNGGLDYPSAIGPAVEDYKNRVQPFPFHHA